MALAVTGAKADDYNPIPPAWSIKINMPGLLSAATEYCTQMGQCAWVGNDVIGPHGERYPRQITLVTRVPPSGRYRHRWMGKKVTVSVVCFGLNSMAPYRTVPSSPRHS